MIERSPNLTNVIWSFNSAGLTDDLMETIAGSNVNAVRLVAGDRDYKTLLKQFKILKDKFYQKGRMVPILVDAVRKSRGNICNLIGPFDLTPNQQVTLKPQGKGGDLEIDGSEWSGFFRDDTLVYLGNGVATLMPETIGKDQVTARVVQGGRLLPGIEVHCPLTRQAPSFSEISMEEIRAYGEHKVDAIVVQATSTAEEMALFIAELNSRTDSPPWIILKVDTLKCYEQLEEFMPHIKGVLISRVELAMCMDPAKVPMVTKEIIQLCNNKARIVVVASDILASMRTNATPTRAEVSDIANSAMDGADGVVLSEDLFLGTFAVRGLQLAKRTIADIESQYRLHDLNWVKHSPEINDTLAAVTYTAYRTAHRNNAKAIVCLTNQGNTALLLASFRTDIPIFAVTLSRDVLCRLGLIRGVYGLLLEDAPGIDEVLPMVTGRILKDTWLKSGDKIVFVSVSLSSIGETASNLFTVQTLQ